MTAEQIASRYDAGIVVVRWAATWVDFLLFWGVLFAFLSALERYNASGFMLALGLCLLLLLGYYPLTEGFAGKTLGKLVCGLKVVNAQGETPGIGKALIRTLLRVIDINPLLMGGLPAGIAVLTSRKRQRIGDMAAGTFVLRSADLRLLQAPLPDALDLPRAEVTAAPVPVAGLAATPVGTLPQRPGNSARRIGEFAALFTVMAIGLISVGVAGLQAADRARPLTLSCAQFLAAPPHAGYYHLTGCDYVLTDASFESPEATSADAASTDAASGGANQTAAVQAIYVPVFGDEDHEGERTPLVVQMEDARLCNMVAEMNKLANDEKKLRNWTVEHYAELQAHRDITGTIQDPFWLASSIQTGLDSDRGKTLADKYVILKEGAKPFSMAGMFSLASGVIFCVLAFLCWLSSAIHRSGQNTPRSTL